MLKKLVSFLAVILVVLVFGATKVSASHPGGVLFIGALDEIKSMLENGQYEALSSKYLARKVKLGTYRSEYIVETRNAVKNAFLKRYSYKVISRKTMSASAWNEHFTAEKAKKRGIVVVKVLDKKTKKTIGKGSQTTVVIFQVLKKDGRIKIFGLLDSTLGIIKSLGLIP